MVFLHTASTFKRKFHLIFLTQWFPIFLNFLCYLHFTHTLNYFGHTQVAESLASVPDVVVGTFNIGENHYPKEWFAGVDVYDVTLVCGYSGVLKFRTQTIWHTQCHF